MYKQDNIILTMLIIPNALHILWCLRSLSVEIRKPNYIFNGLNPTLCLNGRNSTLIFHGPKSTPNWFFFKILKFSGLSLLGMMSSTLQPISCLGFIMTMVIVISFAREHKSVPSDYAPEIIQSPTKLNDKI